MTKVSIIVAIYCVEEYLRKCVDSIIGQTYEDIEIILVDDGSPDRCPAICDEYKQIDTRIQVIHKRNGGLSDARNVGIRESSGEYIAFIDGDDYVAANFVEVLIDQATAHDADISVCAYYAVYGQTLVRLAKRIDTATLTSIEALRDIFTYPSLCER